MLHPVAIIGAGPAGIAAAIQLKRSGIRPLLFEKNRIGGLLLNAHLVENYPGFPQGISGRRLVVHFIKQIDRLGIKVVKEEVKKVKLVNGRCYIVTNKKKFWTKTVIVASGTRPRPAAIKGEAELIQQGRLYYEIRDLPRISRKDTITIIGGGDAAFDYALNLIARIKAVNIIYRGKHPKCLPLLWQRVRQKKRIKLLLETIVISAEKVCAKGKNCLMLTVKKGNKIRLVHSDWLLVAVGREPEIEYLPYSARQTDKMHGLFMVGDVKRGDFRQTGIAIGDGLLASMKVVDYLKDK